uniref:NADH dehydrogenase subunit 6 n=1 Tax=Callistethus plagiicollis TaxID=1618295 RepID=UPI00286B2834|nr:NADH dehydrogenase subunit 6 [Callistethus plagiicollis]WKW91643.1 NADH dehydrogenase subunit 6 [Callistethus plagiicollis]
MILILMLLSFISSMTFMFLTHPLSMGMMLLMQTIVMALTMGFFNINFWYSYILFLIMIGGMLVLFIYMTSVASNEKFQFSVKLTIMVTLLTATMFFIIMMMDPYFSDINSVYTETVHNYKTYNMSFSKYMSYPNIVIMYTMIIYLLITLIAVVKITQIESGPLRQTN